MVQCQALPKAVQKKILAMILSKLMCVVLNPYIMVFKSLIDCCAIIDIYRQILIHYISILFLFETTNMLVFWVPEPNNTTLSPQRKCD